MVTVIQNVGDMKAAKGFVNSEDLKKAMEGAGVVGKPKMRFSTVDVLDKEAGKAT